MKLYKRLSWKYYNAKLYIKSAFQKLTKGYSDSETWSLDISLAKWIIPRLKHFRDNTFSTPPNLENPDSEHLTITEWKEKLDKIIYSFKFILNEDEIIDKCYPPDFDFGFDTIDGALIPKDKRKPDFTYYEECKRKHREGMEVFKNYILFLWS